MSIFGDHNPFQKRNIETRDMPSPSDLLFLEDVIKFTKKKQITSEVLERIEEISDGLDVAINYNVELDTKDENDYRLVNISPITLNNLSKAKDQIGILTTGSVAKFKKERLKEILQTGHKGNGGNFHIFPQGFNWEADFALFYPEDTNKKLAPKGNWILILDDFAIQHAPKKYDIHYATRSNKACMSYGGVYKKWYASIVVDNKEVLMQPHEYALIPDTNVLLDNIGKGIEMIEGSSSARLDKNKVFYLKSRGFDQAEIYQILFKSITSKGFCHFRLDEDYAEHFDLIQRGVIKPFEMRTEMDDAIDKHMSELPNFKFKKPC